MLDTYEREPQRAAFSTTAPTRDWIRRRAIGTPSPHVADELAPLRAKLQQAMSAKDLDTADETALAIVAKQVAAHRLAEAAHELERVLAWLEATGSRARWPMLLTLAAIYDGLADPVRARASAGAAACAAIAACSPIGRARARALLHRLDAAAARAHP